MGCFVAKSYDFYEVPGDNAEIQLMMFQLRHKIGAYAVDNMELHARVQLKAP